jgi:hypothetical protein
MPFFLRTRLAVPEPPVIALTVGGKARVRVRGQVYGFVYCAGELRWAFGAFDQTFRISRRGRQDVSFHALGLGGWSRVKLPFSAPHDLTVRQTPGRVRRVHWSPLSVPRLRPLSALTIRRGLSEHERG